MSKSEHSVLIKFRGATELNLYMNIIEDAQRNNLPVRTYIVMLLKKAYNKEILINGDAENHKE
jgi:hypothetical protein|tara:strand:- start:2702 stop:2890 length:189 start_codon:yes stop_codon:yes gene_type:complete